MRFFDGAAGFVLPLSIGTVMYLEQNGYGQDAAFPPSVVLMCCLAPLGLYGLTDLAKKTYDYCRS